MLTEHEAIQHFCWRVLDLSESRKTSDLRDLALAVGGPKPRERREWGAIKEEVLQTLGLLSGDEPAPPLRDPRTERHLILKQGMPLPAGTFTKAWPLMKDYGKNAINLVYEP